MKAEKRIKYGEREEKRLIKMLEAAKELKEQDGDDKVMESENKEKIPADDEIAMDTSAKAKYSLKTMKDETGNIMMLNLENAENVSFGFVNHDQSASKYD